MENVVAFDPALRRAEQLLAEKQYRAALEALRHVHIPAAPDPRYVERVIELDSAARRGLASAA